ncbi:hypothetical protein [Glutamicibacter arilaitensis]|uniref:hypothetical protein n=1 Tax=Glutamicibacter arilaitensis TaxID=256701 RepID=UPI00384FA3AE
MPYGDGTASIHWHLEFDSDSPRALAEIADSQWEFELNAKSIELLGQIVNAVATGRITDRRRGLWARAMSMEMRIELDSGDTLKQREKIRGFLGHGTFAVSGRMGERMERRNHRFAAWS